ncbi:IS481 family transposase [Candidatus Spongiihabitans sp.]|uniref:IS481 family transposase n=1 Tax=Candidatus Spongiihabitans sp. TaxID=3101308 RepID=UPI003C6F191D
MNNDIAKQRIRTLEFRDRHGLEAALERSGKCRRTLYSWRRRWRERGLIGLAPESKGPRQRRRRNCLAEVIERIRHYRELLPNLGKEQVAVLLLPWCKQRGLGCPGAAAVGRLIGAAADNMRGSKLALTAKGKPKACRRQSVQRRPKGYRPQRSGECVGLDAIERRMGGLRRYILTCIDEVSDHAVAMAVPQISSQAAKRFFEACFKLTPFNIQQVITDSGSECKGEFDQLLKDSNIVHPWTYPKTPKMNAHGERSTAPSKSGSSTATRARCSTTWLYSTKNWPIG